MSTQPKALELANYLEKMAASPHDLEIIDELRRLDSEATGHLADLEAYQRQREGLLLVNKILEQERDSLRSELAAANLRIENHARLIKGYQEQLAGMTRPAVPESYELIDRFLRNNLGDDDYAEYSAALDYLASPQPSTGEAQ